MDVEEAIRARRTHKVYEREPVDRATVDELLELARWAPNHHLTNPWRFRVIGPEARQRLKDAAGPEAATKLDRAPTLVAATAVRAPEDASVFDKWDAANVSPMVGYLATAECPFNGETFYVYGSSVQRFQSWTLVEQIDRGDRRWTVGELIGQGPGLAPRSEGPSNPVER